MCTPLLRNSKMSWVWLQIALWCSALGSGALTTLGTAECKLCCNPLTLWHTCLTHCMQCASHLGLLELPFARTFSFEVVEWCLLPSSVCPGGPRLTDRLICTFPQHGSGYSTTLCVRVPSVNRHRTADRRMRCHSATMEHIQQDKCRSGRICDAQWLQGGTR
jgi:hypothetical protein